MFSNILSCPIQHTMKRMFDVAVCLLLIGLGWWLFIVIALLVRISSPGPVLFRQKRLARGGKSTFDIIKFRSMTVPPEKYKQSIVWTKQDVERTTSIGNFLRDFGLDELPQVINIIKGDMSVIGPRPLLPGQEVNFTPRQKTYLDMRPGVVTYSSVRGRRSLTFQQKVALNVWYVENWSLWLDLKILFQALFVVILRKNARFSVPQEPKQTRL